MRYDNRKLSLWRKKTDNIGQRSIQMNVSSFIENFTTYENLNLFTQPNDKLSFCLWSYDKAVSLWRYDVTFDILFMALIIWTLRWTGGNGGFRGFWRAGEDVGEVFDRRGWQVDLSVKANHVQEREWRRGGEAEWRWISKASQDTLRGSRNRSRRSGSRRERI